MAGKSTLIKALFPGLELSNDVDGVNIRAPPIYGFDDLPTTHATKNIF